MLLLGTAHDTEISGSFRFRFIPLRQVLLLSHHKPNSICFFTRMRRLVTQIETAASCQLPGAQMGLMPCLPNNLSNSPYNHNKQLPRK